MNGVGVGETKLSVLKEERKDFVGRPRARLAGGSSCLTSSDGSDSGCFRGRPRRLGKTMGTSGMFGVVLVLVPFVECRKL